MVKYNQQMGVCMKIINFSNREFSKLEYLNLPKNLCNQEAKLYLLDSKQKWEHDLYVLKCFNENYGRYFSNKLYTINELINMKDKINMDELVFPIALFSVNGEVKGYIMPFVKGVNLKAVLDSPFVPFEKKFVYLKKVGLILEKMRKVRLYNGVPDFYLNDLHEGNFVVDAETDNLKVVDLDSAKIGTNEPMIAKYLRSFSKINTVSKYHQQKNAYCNTFIPDENTDLYCYMIMIFNCMFGKNIDDYSITYFYEYLEYLDSLGVPREFLRMASGIYDHNNNENPCEYIEKLIPFYGRANVYTYEKVRAKKIA